MTILNRNNLPTCGPYIQLAYRQSPLTSWPSYDEIYKDVFFELAEDLLGCLCSLTDRYSPFDPYELTNLSESTSLRKLVDELQKWVNTIQSLEDDVIADHCMTLADDYAPLSQGIDSIKRDLIETLMVIMNKVKSAEELGYTITIIGI